MEQINLNLIPGEALPIAHASQYDVGRTIRLNLFEGSSVYTLSSEATVSLDVKKSDGTIVTAALSHTQTTYVDFTTTEQMTAAAGKALCELKIDTIGTLNFILDIERGPKDGSIESDSEINDLESQITTIINNMGIGHEIDTGPYTYSDI